MSVFIDCFKNNGYDYIRIVDGRRFKKEDGTITSKKTVIKNLGLLKKFDDGKGEGLLLRVRAKFREGTLDIGMSYDDLPQKAKKESAPAIKNPAAILDPKNIGYFIIESIFNKLGISDVLRQYKSTSKIKYDVLGLAKLLTFGRILEPRSKKATFENKDKYLFPVTTSDDLNEIYKTLDVLNHECRLIQKRMNTKIAQSSIGRAASITYYDVTNYFFETHYPDQDVYKLDDNGEAVYDAEGNPVILEKGFRKKGACKKHSGKPIVAMGLFIDSNGIPVSYEMFSGNTNESVGFKEIIIPTLDSRNLGRVIIVADNAMYDQEAQKLLVTNGNGYIISKSVRESWHTKPRGKDARTLRDFAMDGEGYNCVYDRGKVTFKSKSRVYDRILKDSDGKAVTIREKQVVFWNIRYYAKNVHEHEKLLKELEFYRSNPKMLLQQKKKYKKFVKVMQVDEATGEVMNPLDVVVLLDKKIQKEREILGYYSIVTSETELDDKEIINRYRGLSRIEDSFRIVKSDLDGRPVYVWTREHINAHFLLCFIALTIIRLIQYKVLKYQGKEMAGADGWEQGITAEKIKDILNNFNANHIGDGLYQISVIKDEMEELVMALEMDFDLYLPDKTQIAGIKRKIATIKI